METINLQYASFGRRFVALILDALIILIPCAVFGHVVPILGGIIVWALYAPLLESSEIRATIGKHLMGIQVCDENGARISLRTAYVRELCKFISGMMLCLGYLVALFTSKSQTLHDMIADTVVVYGRSSVPIGDAWMANAKELFRTLGISGAATPITELERLQSLRERGVLSEEEFQTQKQKILNHT